jgi:GTP cyclohydrolase IA
METQSTTAQVMERAVTWGECYQAAGQLWHRIRDKNPKYIYGIPRGGCMAALLVQSLAHRDGTEVTVLDTPNGHDTVIIDDLVDSGNTIEPWFQRGYTVEALYRKPYSPTVLAPHAMEAAGWLTFPWETKEGTGAEDCVVRLLQYIGEDPNRNGLLETPKRVLKAWRELTSGYHQDYKSILNKSFDQPHDELVLLRGVEFHSTCEHHMLPFYGTAAVGYIPTDSVVGISKLARLVDCFARRLQIQERLTKQIADSIQEVLRPNGVGVVLKAKHACMGCRGVMKPDSDMVTSVMLGALRDNVAARAEFLSLVNL